MIKILTNQYFYLGLILLLGFYLRLYKLDAPIADWHSWRQADTAAVTRNFIKEGFNPFYPKYDDMSGVAKNPIINTGRFRFVEFPVYNVMVYPFYLLFGVDEKYHRLVSIIFSLGSIVFLFLITRKYADFLTALIAGFVFAAVPFNVFFSRTTLPEPTFIFFALGMVYFVGRWIFKNSKTLFFLAASFTMVAFLMKPWAAFFAFPLLYFFINEKKKLSIRYPVFLFISLTPFLIWRLWILQQPEGIPDFTWLTNSDGIRFRPAWWWWLFSERIGGEILSVAGAILLFLGLLVRPKNGNYFFHLWFLSSMLFMVIFATGNVRHNYYQISFVPIASIFVAVGVLTLFRGSELFIARMWRILAFFIIFPLMFYFGWKQTNGFYQINNPAIVEAGEVADKILPKEALVLAPYNGDTAFLYQINRPGWPNTPLPIQEMVTYYGATHYVSSAKDAKTKWVMRYFEVLVDNPDFVIADLTKMTRPLELKDPEP